MTPYAKANDNYLLQKVLGASPEQLVALLLEGAQRFLNQSAQAISRKDFEAKGRALNKVSAIIEELEARLDMDQGGELAQNLFRIYEWWNKEVFEAGAHLDASRLARVAAQMGDLRQTWEQAHQKRVGSPGASMFLERHLVG